jgi:RimJ/RimL family protein N-acetyltransferase
VWQHPSREELDAADLTDLPASAVDLDIMIGEPDALGRGLGPEAIRRAAGAALSDPAVLFVMACVALDNSASLRAFGKTGFEREWEFDDVPGGRYALLVRRRKGEAP